MNDAILKGVAEILNIPADPLIRLADCESWDSLSLISVMALLDDHGINSDFERVNACETVGDIAGLT